jgi:primosomal protein N' (replication factor Y)
VIVQTYSPDHPAITCLRSHDYEGFVRGELARREEAQYPPFSRMIAVRVDGPDETQVRAAATDAASRARAAAGTAVQVLGPAEAPLARLRGRSRWQVWLSGPDRVSLAAVAQAAAGATLARDVRLAVDVDPQSVL